MALKGSFFICIMLILSCNLNAQLFSNQLILEDLKYLYKSLEDTHYDLYAYISKQEFYKNYQEVKQLLRGDSITKLAATTVFQKVISAANTGHAEIDFPVESYIAYAQEGGTVFPLEIAIEEEQYLVRRNYSGNLLIKNGAEVISINGQPIQLIVDSIHQQISAERMYFKNAKLEFWSFPRLYWQLYGKQDSFETEIVDKSDTLVLDLAAVDVINGYEMRKIDILVSDREIKFLSDIAYLKPGSFSGNEVMFRHFIDSAFNVIIEEKSSQLIIDLRNNAGGDNTFSDYLVSFITDQSFKWHSKFSLKSSELLKEYTRLNNDTTDTYYKDILEHKNGAIYDYSFDEVEPQATAKQFKGEVYVLINRQTYSQAALTAAQIQDYELGTIVGEETGDVPTLYASQFAYTLPNTGVAVKVPKGYIVRVNKSEKLEGVLPNIFIRDRLLDEQDEMLETLLLHLKKK